MYKVIYTSQAVKDSKKIKNTSLNNKVKELILIIEKNPYLFSPPFEILSGELKGLISRRINKQHRLVYQVLEAEKIVKMWTHYE